MENSEKVETNAFENMDRMYRYQRYFYDATRKYYLLGRDRLISEMNIKEGENVLEIGCGTGRNLIILARKHPKTNFFGLDASAEMLKSAQRKIDRLKIENIHFEVALADDFKFGETFNLPENFDTCYFSYSISMIPTWKESIENCLENLKAGRSFYIVDFYDQKDLPAWFRKILKGWLRQFHVRFWGDLLPHLEELESRGIGKLSVKSIYKSYSFIAEFKKL